VPSALDAKCKAPRGTADPIKTKADMPLRLVGRWYFCPGSGKDKQQPLSHDEGIEFDPDGTWWWLASDGAGGFMRKPGVENAGKWDQDWVDEDQANTIYLRFWNNSFMWLALGFETDPRRMLGTYYDPDPIHAVPITD
jgi:hypothetical protein